MPVWLFHGMNVRIVLAKCSELVYQALGGTRNKNLHMTVFSNASHACWRRVYDNFDVYTWLLEKKLRIE